MPYGFLESLRDDIRNGALPEVSWIIPPSVYSEHPGRRRAAGTQAVLDALTANPEVWSKTVLLVNYDENDGFFDTCRRRPCCRATPTARSRAAIRCGTPTSPPSTTTSRRPRRASRRPTAAQPAARADVGRVAVEPRRLGQLAGVRPYVDAALEQRFGVAEPQISAYRRAVCGDLTSAFNFRSPNHEPLPTLAGHTTKSRPTR